MSEEDALLAAVLAAGRRRGLDMFHVSDSRRMRAGLPDLIVIGDRGILWRELKSPYGVASGQQKRLGWRLKAAGQDWGIWRPLDLRTGQIERELDALRRAAGGP